MATLNIDMEPGQLRLILLFIGIILVIGIYAWDRFKRSRRRLKGLSIREARRLRRELDELDEPTLEELPDLHVDRQDRALIQEELFPLESDPQPAAPEWDAESPQQMVTDSEPEPETGQEDLYEDLSMRDDLPQLVLQIGLVAREGEFSGVQIEAAMKQVDMKPGAMNIYHRYDSRRKDKVLFSIANMLKPGHFPIKKMQGFSTPGLLLFTQLPGVRDGMDIYSDMLYAANELAGLLDGKLQDETRSTLTKQSIQHTRDQILEHRRKLRLAGVKV